MVERLKRVGRVGAVVLGLVAIAACSSGGAPTPGVTATVTSTVTPTPPTTGEALTIAGANMEHTLTPGQSVTPVPVGSPARGAIIAFNGPPGWPREHEGSASIFVSRVIAVGGDTVACTRDVLVVNGTVRHETYLYPHSHPCSGDGFEGKTVHVPLGQVFVMGDHRDDSEDSRVNGTVPVTDVLGKIG